MVVNALISQDREIDLLLEVLKEPNNGFKCIYLGEKGCLWRLKPIVCEMFLCEHAKKEVLMRARCQILISTLVEVERPLET